MQILEIVSEYGIQLILAAGTAIMVFFNRPKTAEKLKKLKEKHLAKLKKKAQKLITKLKEIDKEINSNGGENE